jgi:mannosyl-3-phosphoglycerate phosphatase
MPSVPATVIVFVDVDAAPACPFDRVDRLAGLLERLASARIMIVFVSRRTRAEVEGIRQSLGIFHPFVCESGGGAFVPRRYFGSGLTHARSVDGYQVIDFGSPYEQVVDTLRRVATGLRVRLAGFNDLPLETVARECGCTLLDAGYARRREYDEPFRLRAPDAVAQRRLLKALAGAGLTCTRHGVFHHAGTVPGPGAAIRALTRLYRAAFGAIVTVGAGTLASSPDQTCRVASRVGSRHAGAPPPRTQVEWLERIVQNVGRIRSPERVAGISTCGGAEIPSSGDGPASAAFR